MDSDRGYALWIDEGTQVTVGEDTFVYWRDSRLKFESAGAAVDYASVALPPGRYLVSDPDGDDCLYFELPPPDVDSAADEVPDEPLVAAG